MCVKPTQKDSTQPEKGEQFCGQKPGDRLLPGFKFASSTHYMSDLGQVSTLRSLSYLSGKCQQELSLLQGALGDSKHPG